MKKYIVMILCLVMASGILLTGWGNKIILISAGE